MVGTFVTPNRLARALLKVAPERMATILFVLAQKSNVVHVRDG